MIKKDSHIHFAYITTLSLLILIGGYLFLVENHPIKNKTSDGNFIELPTYKKRDGITYYLYQEDETGCIWMRPSDSNDLEPYIDKTGKVGGCGEPLINGGSS